MSDSDRFDALMLEHLYGLLDSDEARELQKYLETPAGEGLRARAEQMQAKLTGAARAEFPNVRFAPPATTPAMPLARPAPARGTVTMNRYWTRWAVAACLLLVFGGLGAPAAYQFIGWYAQSSVTKELKFALDDKRNALSKLEAEQRVRREQVRKEHAEALASEQAAAKAYSDALASARKAIEQKDFHVRLTGPDRIQPGAPNAWTIETLTRTGGYASPKKIDVVVKDQKDVELLRESHQQPHGKASLTLPTSFWEKVTPGSDLFLEVVAFADDDRRSVLAERVPLARPVYVTHLVTDKPLYKPGEKIRFRSLTLDRATFLPPAHDQHLKFWMNLPDGARFPLDEGNGRLIDEKNHKPIVGADGKPLRGIGTGEYELPDDAAGGEYAIEVFEITPAGQENLLETRKFLVNQYVPDVFEKKVEFDGKSYGPSDPVQARIEVSRTAGGPMKNARATITAATSDGRQLHSEKDVPFSIVTDPATRQVKAVCNVRFKLPSDLFVNRKPLTASLSVVIQDGSEANTIVRPIPLVDKDLKIEFFPEGGDLIDGVPGRVYLQVRTPAGKPADLKGVVTDGTDTIAEISTLTDADHEGVNRGQGLFSFTPKAGKTYFLKLKSPAGINEPTKDGFPLPEVKADGIALTALDAVTEKGDAIRMRVQVGKGPKTLHIGAYARGRLISHKRIEAEAGKPIEIKLQGDESVGGVTRVTVFEEPKAQAGKRVVLIPRAERLVYRKPGEQLLLTVNPDKNRYSPGGKVAIDIAAMNEKERATPAILLVGVVNQSVIAMADNKTDRLMPTHFLLAGDVKNPADLEHADFLLMDHPKAAVALDLLLGTQGWRRFAEQNATPSPVPEVERMMLAHGQRSSAPVEMVKLEEQRVAAEYQPKLEQADMRLANAIAAQNQFQTADEADYRNRQASAQGSVKYAEDEHRRAATALFDFETRVDRMRTWALPLFLLGLIGVAAVGITLAVGRKVEHRRRYFATAGGAFVLAILALGGVILSSGTPDAQSAYSLTQVIENNRHSTSPTPNAPMAGGAIAKAKAADPKMPAVGDGGPIPPPLAPAPGGPPPAPKVGPRVDPVDPVHDKKADGRLDIRNFKADRGAKGARGQEKAQLAPRRDPMNVAGGGGPGAPGFPAMPPGIAIPQPVAFPFVVREYAHGRNESLGAIRSDFTETVFWHPVLVLPENGRTKVEFQLSDDIARYQVLVAGHTVDGRIGAITKSIEARKPFTVDPKLPLEINSNDVMEVPIRVVNDSDDHRAVSFTLQPGNLTFVGATTTTPDGQVKDLIQLGPNEKGRKLFRLKATGLDGQATLAVVGNSEAAEPDAVGRVLKVVPEGFPVVGSFSDMLETRASGSITLPKDLVPGTLKVRLEVYPTSMADLVKGLDGLLREPNGCFEQTSTSNYPNTLILDYLNSTNQTNPEASRRAKELLDRGYTRLTSYECPDTPAKVKQGFEWFGSPDMAHEALTAYGLLQFKDMARVHKVDPELIKRTQAFLLSRKDGNGGFKRNARALDSFGGAPKHTTDAYIVWALVESDPDDTEKPDLKKEIDALKAEALKEDSTGGKDAYFVALTANVLLQRSDRESALKLLDRLKDKNLKAGAVTGGQASITRSGGRDLEIETTAIAMLGWLRANDTRYAVTIKDATKWISQQRGGYGGFGSTQSTIMALKALILHAKKSAHPSESGEIKVLVNGKPVATKRFSEKDVEVIALDIDKAAELFKPGEKADVEIVTDAKHPCPFALNYTGTTLTPVSADKCGVQLQTKLARVEAEEGETVPLTVSLENRQPQGQGMAVAIVGVPAGMKVPIDMKQLTELREKGVISYFETRGRELVLYWRELAPSQKVAFTVDLVCEIPGQYRGPASRGYLYYNADHKHWVEPLEINIRPMAGKVEELSAK